MRLQTEGLLEVKECDQKLVEAWVEFLDPMGFNGFFTVTFDPNRFAPATSAMLAIDRASRAIGKFYDARKVNQWSFIVAEQHRSGIYHCHGLVESASAGSDEIKKEFSDLKASLGAQCGFSRVEQFRDPDHVRSYVSKYLIKTQGDHRFVGQKR